MEITTLQLVWFLLVAVLWTGYLVLEGFDFGVGMLMPIVGKTDKERRAAINTIGPIWDGNEVWLITAGGAMFAAFPEWYATLFSGFYLALFIILVALIIRICAFEYRSKIDQDRWRKRWDWCIILGSWIPAVLWGVAFGNMISGVPLDSVASTTGSDRVTFVGSFFDLLFNPFALLGGAVTATVFLMHGAVFLSMKTDGIIRQRATRLAPKLAILATVVAAIWVIWMQLAYSKHAWTWVPLIVAALALVGVILSTLKGKMGPAFTLSTIAILCTVVMIFGTLYPNVMNTSLDDGVALSIAGAASTDKTLGTMTVIACILVPFVLAYQAWSIYVFRKRISAERIPDPHEPTVANV